MQKQKQHWEKKVCKLKKQKYIWLSFAQKVLHPEFVSTECVVLFIIYPRTSECISFVYVARYELIYTLANTLTLST